MTDSARSVVRSYLIIAGLWALAASVIWSVNTLFLLDAGLNLFQVFIANAAFTFGMVAFEIPTGVLADTIGRRASFLAAAAVLCLGTIAYLLVAELGGGLPWFVAASLALGLGFTFYSGAVEAWLVDALHDTGYNGDMDPIFANGAIASGAAMIVGSIGGGLLGGIDLALPMILRALLLLALIGVAAVVMHDRGFQPRRVPARQLPAEMASIARAGLDHGLKVRPARSLFYLNLLQFGFLTWAFYAWQPFVLEFVEDDLIWLVGLTAAAYSGATMLGNSLVGFLARPCGRRTTLLLPAAALLAAAAAALGFATELWQAIVLWLLVGAALGVLTPVQQAFLHRLIPGEQRATVVSVGSMFGSAGGIGSQLGFGYISQSQSLGAGYVAAGATSAVALPILWLLRRQRSDADVLVAASEAGQRAACAAQGLPGTVGIDSVPRLAHDTA